VSPELRDLIEKMLIKDPNKRISLPEIKVSCRIWQYISIVGLKYANRLKIVREIESDQGEAAQTTIKGVSDQN
jgi:serine/threonine protein kinase